MNKVESSQKEARGMLVGREATSGANLPERALVGLPLLAHVTSLSERTIFRLMKDPEFPRIKVGRRTLFNGVLVLEYLSEKFGNKEAK
jgi:predicted DNA-binding transcriptional regulator AlpA